MRRTQDAYASSDGRGNILIAPREALDADDSLAQLVLHEICHALVEGDEGAEKPDWGLDNTNDRDVPREHACLRVQAVLADPHGLRAVMVPTTSSREYYVALPADPVAESEDPAVPLARAAIERASSRGWRSFLDAALAETAIAVARLVEDRKRQPHPLGFPAGPAAESCGTCAWRYLGGRGPAVQRCRQSAGPDGNGKRVEPTYPACERWEPPVDCLTCGACCREAYHVVSVRMRDDVVWKHPHLVERKGHHFNLLRAGERCASLDVRVEGADRRYGCTIYDDRPQTCRDFARGGVHCLTARRRVGLSV